MRCLDLFTIAAGTALIALPLPALAEQAPATPALAAKPSLTLTGGVTGVSRYRFRGIGLSDEKPASQATITLNHDSGFYAGAWASSLDGFGELGGAKVEVDLSGGYKAEVASGVTLDGGLLYYAYPGSTGGDFEFFEPYASASGTIGPVTTKVGVAFAPAQDGIGGNSNLYLYNDTSLPIGSTPVTLNSHLGWSKGDTTLTPGGQYLDWSLGASVAWRRLALGLNYVDTSIGRRDAIGAGATRDIVDGALVVSLGASF